MLLSRMRVVLLWSLVLAFWLVVSRSNHPTLLLNLLSTSILVVCSAASFGVWNAGFRGKSWAIRLLLRSAGTVSFGIAAAVIIHVVYDVIHGPDPLRFSPLANVIMDIAFVGIHVLLAWFASWLWKMATQRRVVEKSAA